MKAPPFKYHAPSTLTEALDLLASLENARALAGGQSLMPMLNLRLAAPAHLVDLGRIPDLASAGEEDGQLRLGAMTKQRFIEKSTMIAARCPLLAETIRHVGHQQTRNRGTIGGSLCHLDPGAELPVMAAALDAELTIASSRGQRTLAFRDFATGYLSNALAPDELLTTITLPVVGRREGCAFMEFNRRPADFAVVSVATILSLDESNRVTRVRIAIGGVQSAPVRLTAAEDMMHGESMDAQLFKAVGDIASNIDCDGDEVYPADYRKELCGVLVQRALAKAHARAMGASDA